MIKRIVLLLAALLVVLGIAGFLELRALDNRTDPYVAAVVERFDDGQIMNTEQAECVGQDVRESIDWDGVSERGFSGDTIFGDGEFSDRFTPSDTTALIDAIDECRGADEVVLAIFVIQLGMDREQFACFADHMNEAASVDLLRLIIADGDTEGEFADSEGAVLLNLCGRGVL